MLHEPTEEVAALLTRYRRQNHPLDRLKTLAALQRATGPALAAAVDACRDEGSSWPLIGATLNMPRATLLRQHRAGVITVPTSAAEDDAEATA